MCNPGGVPSITQHQIHWKHKSIFCHYFQNIFSDSEININLSLPSLPEQNARCQKEKCTAINNKLDNKCHWRQSFIVGTTWNIQVEFVKQPIKIYIEVDVKSWLDVNVYILYEASPLGVVCSQDGFSVMNPEVNSSLQTWFWKFINSQCILHVSSISFCK